MPTPHTFTADGVKRIIKQVRRDEKRHLNDASGRVVQPRFGVLSCIGKADADIAKADDGSVSIWAGVPGSEADTTYAITAWNAFGAIDSGSWVMCINNGYGWYIIAAECPA
jgi:hypothetical protein